MEAVRVEELSKDFGGVHALRNIAFCVEVGERLVIIGPNGAGKTTLFNLINGQLSATGGRIYLHGQEVTGMAIDRRAHLGLARSFQAANLFSNLKVIDNALLALQGTQSFRFQMFRSIMAYTDIFAKAQELLETVGLWEKRDELVKDLGHGEQKKLEIALSVSSEPKLLLLDEPTAGLTAAESSEVVDMIHNLGIDITVLIVAHDMDLVFGVADRIIVLHYGEIIAEGTPEEIQANSRVKEIYMGIEEGRESAGAN